MKSPKFRNYSSGNAAPNPFLKAYDIKKEDMDRKDSSEALLDETKRNASKKNLNSDPFISRLNELKRLYETMKRDVRIDEDNQDSNFFQNIRRYEAESAGDQGVKFQEEEQNAEE